MAGTAKIIELVFGVDVVGPADAVLPKERDGPVTMRITPAYVLSRSGAETQFRVEFEPENEERRRQPYRATLEPEFPDGWKIGQPFKPKAW
jgi:hypothetical protein